VPIPVVLGDQFFTFDDLKYLDLRSEAVEPNVEVLFTEEVSTSRGFGLGAFTTGGPRKSCFSTIG
jgi:hypothetical protein